MNYYNEIKKELIDNEVNKRIKRLEKKLEAIDEENIQKFYNRDIFDNASSSSEVIDSEAEESNEENSLVEYKETFFKKIWNKIKSIFNKNK